MPRPLLAALVAAVAIAAVILWPRDNRKPNPVSGAEAGALTASKGLAWRDGNTLNVKMKSGEVLTLADHASCGDLPCPRELATRYRYDGWDEKAGGYRLKITLPDDADGEAEMILPFSDDPTLVDARHPELPPAPLPQPAPPSAASRDEGLADWLGRIAADRDRDEAPSIAATAGLVTREGPRLTLTLADGRRLTFEDDLACGQLACPPQMFRSFAYAGRTGDGRFHVVAENRDEIGSAFLVSSRDGGLTRLLGLPKFSPDGRRAADAIASLDYSAPRRLEVWNLSGAAPVVEFSVDVEGGDDTLYEVTAWTDNDHLRLKSGPWNGETRANAMLSHDDAGWHVEAGEGNGD